MNDATMLKSATELAKANNVRFPNESPEIAAPAMPCWRRRSNSGGISSGWRSSVVRCRPAER